VPVARLAQPVLEPPERLYALALGAHRSPGPVNLPPQSTCCTWRRSIVAADRPPVNVDLVSGWRTTQVDQVKAFTARATIRPNSASATVDWTSIAYLARWLSGMTSVGLKAVAFVKPRWR